MTRVPGAERREPGHCEALPRAADPSGQPLPPALFREIVRQAEEGYPSEICGLVIGRRGAPESLAVRPVRNVADQERPADIAGTPRDARTAYLMDPREQLQVLREADERGWDVLCIYHSHPDHPAAFSAMDRDRAVDQSGRPLWPGAVYLVVSVRAGRACEAGTYAWDEGAAGYAARPLALPDRT